MTIRFDLQRWYRNRRGWNPSELAEYPFEDFDLGSALSTQTRDASSDYFSAFARAYTETLKAGYKARRLRVNPRPVNRIGLNRFERFLVDNKLHFLDSARECLMYSEWLLEVASRAFNVPLELTIGTVYYKNNHLIGSGTTQLLKWAKDGLSSADTRATKNGLQLHAWWTSASGQIIDVTIMSSLAFLKLKPEDSAGDIFLGFPGHPDFHYEPQLLGKDFARCLQNSTGLPLLRDSRQDA